MRRQLNKRNCVVYGASQMLTPGSTGSTTTRSTQNQPQPAPSPMRIPEEETYLPYLQDSWYRQTVEKLLAGKTDKRFSLLNVDGEYLLAYREASRRWSRCVLRRATVKNMLMLVAAIQAWFKALKERKAAAAAAKSGQKVEESNAASLPPMSCCEKLPYQECSLKPTPGTGNQLSTRNDQGSDSQGADSEEDLEM
ncbi:hypothetical protein CFD26_105248 [Aspergillus turcosus]|uniref:Uncharacterized protein n=1 Tax=Aspergillus turcosus TaxID=1245748 RepID=A0A3R7F9T4_9EURO|nr:hypothetical protein CFD26_105248 [Aspergillus turcosus]